MDELPGLFDDDQAPADGQDGERRVWRVTELVESIRDLLESEFPAVWVQGEVSGHRERGSGRHWYFQLKDEGAVLNAVMFRREASRVPFALEDGLEILAFGRVSVYPPFGRMQMIVERMEPVGWGARQLAFEQLRRRLEAEGLFAAGRKRPLPYLPGCVGVVTSPDAAAWRDMVRVWQRRDVPIRIVLSPTLVQGEAAPDGIVEALRRLADWGECDVIVVGRGGGSREDLWCFNDERVARAIAASPVPVVTGIGHEIDVTIADLVADLRAATPTAAAELVAPARVELEQRVDTARRRARRGLLLRLTQARARLAAPPIRRAMGRPERVVQAYEQRLDDAWERVEESLGAAVAARSVRLRKLAAGLRRLRPEQRVAATATQLDRALERVRRATGGLVAQRRELLAATGARVEAMSPLAVLARGYAVCRDSDGRVLRSAAQVSVGDDVDVRLHRGTLRCEVRRAGDEAEG